ncbi:MAG: helicase C-terminal domain-containing protein [Candidatus Hodarchaeota archaeon]
MDIKEINKHKPYYWLKKSIEAGTGQPLKPWVEQEWMFNSLYKELQNLGNCQIASGPTGTGKAAVICGVALRFVSEGKRVLILSPNYTHLENVIQRHLNIPEIVQSVKIAVVRGYSDLGDQCPRFDTDELETGPQRKLCQNWRDNCNEISCPVVKMFSEAGSANIVLSVIHKLIYDPQLFIGNNSRDLHAGKFDVILIDECHNIPDIVTNYREDLISLDSIRKVVSRIESSNKREELIEILDEIPESDFNDRRELLSAFRDDFREYIQSNPSILPKFSIFNSVIYPRRGLQVRSTSVGFLIIRKNVEVDFKGNFSVGLVSATVEANEKFIFEDCRFEGIKVSPADDRAFSSSAPTIRKRFKRLRIFGCTDTPDLKKDQNYSSVRETANELLLKIFLKIRSISEDYKTLILCRSKDDANRISHFMNNTSIKDFLINIDDIEAEIIANSEYDPESGIDGSIIIDKLTAELHREDRSEIKFFLVTGSSRFWEGVNIEDLRFVIIDALPYIAPSPTQSTQERVIRGHFAAHPIFHSMMRKLQQGIGRLMRRDKDKNGNPMWGVCFILDHRFVRQGKYITKRLPQVLIREGTIIIDNLKSNLQKMEADVKRLSDGKPLIVDLEDYLQN